MKKENIFISIILPNFNGGKYLEQCLNSFVNQEYLNKELIIVDGKSKDNSHKIIKHFLSNENIKWVTEIDTGISNAFNIGLKYVKGDVIGYLGSDDILYKNIFNEINYTYSWCEDFDAIYFNSYNYHIKERKCNYRRCIDIEFSSDSLLTNGTPVGLQNIYFKRKIYDKFKLDEENKTCMDYELFLRLVPENLLYVYVNHTSTINIFDDNISSDKNHEQFLELCEVTQKYVNLYNYQGPVCFKKPEPEIIIEPEDKVEENILIKPLLTITRKINDRRKIFN